MFTSVRKSPLEGLAIDHSKAPLGVASCIDRRPVIAHIYHLQRQDVKASRD